MGMYTYRISSSENVIISLHLYNVMQDLAELDDIESWGCPTKKRNSMTFRFTGKLSPDALGQLKKWGYEVEEI